MVLQGTWEGPWHSAPSCSCVPAFPPMDPQGLGAPGSALSHPGGSSHPLDLGGMPPNTTQIHWTP